SLAAVAMLRRPVVPATAAAAKSGAWLAQNRLLATIQGESAAVRVTKGQDPGFDNSLCITCATGARFCGRLCRRKQDPRGPRDRVRGQALARAQGAGREVRQG